MRDRAYIISLSIALINANISTKRWGCPSCQLSTILFFPHKGVQYPITQYSQPAKSKTHPIVHVLLGGKAYSIISAHLV